MDEAEEYCKTILTARLEALGDSHPDSLDAISLMATLLVKKGDLEEADEWSVMALEGKAALFGRDDRATLVEMHSRANILRIMGARAARSLCVRVWWSCLHCFSGVAARACSLLSRSLLRSRNNTAERR